jgi:hypothetical protein
MMLPVANVEFSFHEFIWLPSKAVGARTSEGIEN